MSSRVLHPDCAAHEPSPEDPGQATVTGDPGGCYRQECCGQLTSRLERRCSAPCAEPGLLPPSCGTAVPPHQSSAGSRPSKTGCDFHRLFRLRHTRWGGHNSEVVGAYKRGHHLDLIVQGGPCFHGPVLGARPARGCRKLLLSLGRRRKLCKCIMRRGLEKRRATLHWTRPLARLRPVPNLLLHRR